MTCETPGGKVVLVTGAAGGIGAATARLLALERAILVLTDLDGPGLARVELPPGTAALRLAHDVSDPGSWARVVCRALQEHGRLDALVNVAGVVEPGGADAIPLAHLERQVAVNLLGTMLGCRAVLGPMRARGAGAIVNVASLGGIVPMPGEAAYCATKYGVRGWSFSLRAELRGAGVDVSVVSPDSVRTAQLEHERASGSAPMSFVGRAMAPEVVAAAVVRALRTRAPEVLVPASTGLLARLAMAFPAAALLLLSRLERRGRANMAKRGAPPRVAAPPAVASPVAAPPAAVARAVPSRRARVLGALEIALALGIAAFWAAFFLLGARAIADPPDEGVYLAFETAFPVADGCLALALALAGTGLLRGSPRGPPLSLAAGGALVFLGLLDASFNVLQGTYAAGLPQALGNALVNAACVAGGAAVVAGAWAAGRSAIGRSLPPRSEAERARVRQDGVAEGAA